MSLLVTSQLRFLRRSPWSALTALIGMALGVASVVAVHLISAEVERSLDDSAPPHLAGLTHLLTRPDIDADDYFTLRDWWRDHPRAPVLGLVPMLDGQLSVDGRRVQLVGADWLAVPPGVVAGSAFAVSPEVLVGEAVIADRELGYAVDDRLTLAGRRVVVAGVIDTGLGPALFADIALAQRLLDLGPDRISLVGLAVVDPWATWRRRLDRLMPGFGAGLPQPPAAPLARLLGADAGAIDAAWQARPVTAERPSAAFARSVLFNLGALGTLALLVAWFLIYQVGAIWLRRQHLVLTRLQMVGADPRLLRRSFLALFIGLGLAATVLGGLIGVLLATLLVQLSSAGIEATLADGAARALDPWVLVKAIGSGLGVCLVGGYAAFARESSAAAGSTGRWRWPVLLGLGLLVLLGVTVERGGVLGGFLGIFALCLFVVLLVPPLLGLLRHAGRGARRGRLLTRLALREVAWYPRVLDVALAALTLAVATGIGVGLMVDSFRSDFQRMLDVRLAGDLYLYDVGGRDEELGDWLRAQPEVADVRRFGEARSRLEGVPVELGYAGFDARESARYRFPRSLATGEALVNERLLRDLALQVGDSARVAGGSVTIVGTFPGFGDPRGRVLVDTTSLELFRLPPHFDRLAVTLYDSTAVDADALIGRLGERFPAATVEARAAIRAVALRIFDRTFAITRALTLLALLVAVVGIYNALTALRLNQAATTELLRSQGISAAETRHIALVRAGTLGGVAVALALPLGIAMAWALCTVVNPRSFGWSVALQMPPSGWLPPLLLGLAAALLAGLLPAPRERGALHDAG